MKITNLTFLNHNYEVLDEFFDTLGFNLLEKTLLLPAKGGKYSFSKKKNRTYSDMPYWIHILNGLMSAFLLIDKDKILNESFESNAIYAKVFITAFVFHDANKLIEGKTLEQVLREDFNELLESFEVSSFFPEYQDYIEDMKWLVLNTENGTTPHAFGEISPSLPEPLLDILKVYMSFADGISAKEVHRTYDLYKILQDLIKKKRLPELEIHYLEISKNIYMGLSNAVYKTLEQELSEKIIFRLRDGFIYIGQKYEVNDEKISEEIINDFNEAEAADIAKNEIGGQFFQSISLNFFKTRKIKKEKFIKILDEFIKLKSNSFFKNFEDTSYYQEISSDLPSVEYSNDDQLYIKEDIYDALIEDEKDIWRLLTIIRIVALSFNTEKEFENEIQNINKLEQTKKVNEMIEKGEKSVILHLLYLKKIISADKVKKSLDVLLDKVIKVGQLDYVDEYSNQQKLNLQNFIKTFVSHKFEDIYLNNEQKLKKKQICLICGNHANSELKDVSQNTFIITARNPTNKSITSIKNSKNYICDLCELDNKFLLKFFGKLRNADSILYVDLYDYVFNFNYSQILKWIEKRIILKEVAAVKHRLDESEKKLYINLSANDEFALGSHFKFMYYPYGKDLKSQIYSTQKLLKLIKYTGMKVLVSPIYTPYSQHNEMFAVLSTKNTLKRFGLDKVRIHEIHDALNKVNLLFQLQEDITSIIELSKTPESIFWIIKKNDLSISKEDLFNLFLKNIDMTNTKELSVYLTNVHRLEYNSTSHEETEVIRKSLDILKDYSFHEKSLENTKEAIAGILYKKFKNVKDIHKLSKDFSQCLVDKIYKEEWNQVLPNPKELKYWIAQFAYLYKESSEESWEKIRNNKSK